MYKGPSVQFKKSILIEMELQTRKHFQITLEIILFFGLITACLVQVWGALNLFLSRQTTTTYFKEPIKDNQVICANLTLKRTLKA